MKGIHEIIILRGPTAADLHGVSESSIEESMWVEVWLQSKGFDGSWVKSMSSENSSHIVSLSVLQSIVHLKSRIEHVETFGHS